MNREFKLGYETTLEELLDIFEENCIPLDATIAENYLGFGESDGLIITWETDEILIKKKPTDSELRKMLNGRH